MNRENDVDVSLQNGPFPDDRTVLMFAVREKLVFVFVVWQCPAVCRTNTKISVFGTALSDD